MKISVFIVVCALASVAAFEYAIHDKVPVMANTVGPFNNPAESYKFFSLPFCAPKEEKDHSHDLGQVLAGDRRTHSLYDIRYRVDVQWQALCRFKLKQTEIKTFVDSIEQHYIFELFVDGLSVKGFVGETELVSTIYDHHVHNSSHMYLFTHLDFSIAYNGNNVIACNLTTDPAQRVELQYGKDIDVEFSFGIHWHPTEVIYDNRMELHSRSAINDQPVEIHWLSIINSFVLVILLTAFLAIIFMRVLKKDFARYMELDDDDYDDQEDSGWKLVHGDVFRFPKHAMLLSAAIGTGVQLLVMTIGILLLALVGFFYPGHRGGLYSASILIYAFTASISGYVSTSTYLQWGGDRWALNAVLTACLFTVPFFVVFCFVNTVSIAYGSSSALPFGTIIIVILLWGLVTFPLTIVGSIRGKQPAPYEAPCKTNKVERQIPPVVWYRSTPLVLIFSGFLPFSAIYIELHYIFASVWGHRVYTLFEILFLAFIMLILVTAAISVALTYFQLAAEDYNWWWRSFMSGFSTGVFMYLYGIFYFNFRSEMFGMLQASFFFGYFLMISYGFSLMLGAVSFFVSHKFVRHIYSSIKID